MTAGRYAASPLAPATETGAAVLCTDCGVLVADPAAHDKFHALLSPETSSPAALELPRRPARPAKVT